MTLVGIMPHAPRLIGRVPVPSYLLRMSMILASR